jgi:serine phosphatase RsbU (regulator of sigma subunit)
MMATARTLLRASAQRLVLPAQVLERVNQALAAQLPPGTFVTCFFAILDPASGRLRFANAGQTVPYLRGATGVTELRRSCASAVGRSG